MNYIYDILLNFQQDFYEFYEWNLNDDIAHIRKIPLYKISSDDLYKIRTGSVRVSTSFLCTIFNKTEIFTSRNVKAIPYACLFSDDNTCCAVMFDENGNLLSRSSLLLDEENEVLEVVLKLDIDSIDFEICHEGVMNNFFTRKEQAIGKYIQNEMHKLIQEDDVSKLKYLYYECFDEKEENRDVILSRIQKELSTHFDQVYLSIYNFLKLTSIKR